MATTVSPKNRTPREKKATPKSAAAARKAVASAPVAEAPVKAPKMPARMKRGGSEKFAAEQKPLDGMPEVDPRVPELDEACKAAKAHQAKSNSEREELRERLDEIGILLKEHDLGCYIHNGMKFYEEPGSPKIKMAVVKTK